MKIAIIGAGWYGCHIAKKLVELGLNVTLIDKQNEMFQAASRSNQNRLHYGMHYPRSARTRLQSKRGFHLFMKEYGFLTTETKYNYYAVDNNSSLLDFETYKLIMKYDQLPFEDVSDVCPLRLEHIDGILDCEERIIDPIKAKSYFESQLSSVFEGGKSITIDDIKVLSSDFDYVIDCTWGAFPSLIKNDIFYESSVYFEYETTLRRGVGLTVMDGAFFSIFPTALTEISTVTSVRDVVAKVSTNMEEISDFNNKLSEEFVSMLQNKTEQVVSYYYPQFKDEYRYVKHLVSNKTKPNNKNDARDARVYQNENVISVLSGKIDTVFDVETIILNKILR